MIIKQVQENWHREILNSIFSIENFYHISTYGRNKVFFYINYLDPFYFLYYKNFCIFRFSLSNLLNFLEFQPGETTENNYIFNSIDIDLINLLNRRFNSKNFKKINFFKASLFFIQQFYEETAKYNGSILMSEINNFCSSLNIKFIYKKNSYIISIKNFRYLLNMPKKTFDTIEDINEYKKNFKIYKSQIIQAQNKYVSLIILLNLLCEKFSRDFFISIHKNKIILNDGQNILLKIKYNNMSDDILSIYNEIYENLHSLLPFIKYKNVNIKYENNAYKCVYEKGDMYYEFFMFKDVQNFKDNIQDPKSPISIYFKNITALLNALNLFHIKFQIYFNSIDSCNLIFINKNCNINVFMNLSKSREIMEIVKHILYEGELGNFKNIFIDFLKPLKIMDFLKTLIENGYKLI
jgi:hypothetical protein